MHSPDTELYSPNPVRLTFESRLEARKRELDERREAIRKLHEEAEARGELWSVQAALYPGRTVCTIYQGRVESTAAMQAENPEAGVFLGPTYMTGKKAAVMAEALALFTVDEITIRVVKQP